MKIETVAIADLTPDPANVRVHPEEQIMRLVGMLRRFGQQLPLVADDRNIVRAGNARLEAMRRLGWTHAQIIRSSLTSIDLAAWAVADNKSPDGSTWDNYGLSQLLAAIKADDDLIAAVGFTSDAVAKLLADASPPNFDPVGADAQSRLDTKAPVTCPHCGEEFTPG